ncbi:DHH family phosphoesterase [Patescibacteria group bacterium]|nr:DHH family phosphoesterase [Patescibacteria group bacterium]MBU1674074.1 DHH family phosphoesterase [Patescibacteria group bacterium]MBU1963777.1 DHH family phosphoesterase [Patescibacteria group bacterium]
MKELQDLKGKKKGLIIHHWDTDGLCSAAMLWKFLRDSDPDIDAVLMTPTISNYFLTDAEYAKIKGEEYDYIITCDINFPADVVEKLKEICPEILIFDHHHQKPIDGVFYVNKKYPGCSYIIDEYLGTAPSLLGVMGMVGDKEEGIQEDKEFYPYVEEVLKKEDLTLNELLIMRRYIDSLYIIEDYKNMDPTVELLADDPKEILNDENLANNVQRIDQEVTHYMEVEPKDLGDDILEFNLDSEFNILSHTTRGLAREYNDKIVFVHQEKPDRVLVYVRRTDLDKDMQKIIDFARAKDFSAGGKPEVVGIIVPKPRWAGFKEELIEELRKL